MEEPDNVLDEPALTGRRLKLKEQPSVASADHRIEMASRRFAAARTRRKPKKHLPQDATPISFDRWAEIPIYKRVFGLLTGLPVESGKLFDLRAVVATVLFILLNLVVFGSLVRGNEDWFEYLVFGVDPDGFYTTWGFIPGQFLAAPGERWFTIISSMFIHGGIIHLVCNLAVLCIFGDDVERRMGTGLFIVVYLLSGTVGDLASLLLRQGLTVPHIGASGAISGVMGAYLVLCRHKRFHYFHPLLALFGRSEQRSTWLVLSFFFGMQVYYYFHGPQGIGYAAHIGGFVCGWLAGHFVANRQVWDVEQGCWTWGR